MTKSVVRDVMTRGVITAAESAPFKEIVERLARHGVSALPVLDPDGRVIGVVSEADLMLKEEGTERKDHRGLRGRARRQDVAKMRGKVASELMTTPAVTIGPEAPIAKAARLMHERRIKRLPVIDADGKLLGIVSRRDLLSVFLRSDEQIRDDIADRVIRGVLWIDPGSMHVDVRQGVVTLEGVVDTKGTIPLVVELVEGVDGVVAVDARIRFLTDDTKHWGDPVEPWRVLFRPIPRSGLRTGSR